MTAIKKKAALTPKKITLKQVRPFVNKNPKRANIVHDGFKVLGIMTRKQVEKSIITKELNACSFDMQYLQDMINAIKAIERFGTSHMDSYGYSLYMPAPGTYAPFVIHSGFTGQFYMLAPRLHEHAKIRIKRK